MNYDVTRKLDTVARWQNVIRGVWISAIPIRRTAAVHGIG